MQIETLNRYRNSGAPAETHYLTGLAGQADASNGLAGAETHYLTGLAGQADASNGLAGAESRQVLIYPAWTFPGACPARLLEVSFPG